MRKLEIGKNEAGQRMDKYLKKYLKEAGSGFLYKMIRKKNILLNDKKAEGKEMLQQGDTITLYLAEETIEKFRGAQDTAVMIPQKKSVKLDIIYEDEDFLILNKPAGMLSQKAGAKDISMVEYLIEYLVTTNQITQEELRTFHPSVCNRLDRNTSGLILAGKTLTGLQSFSQMLKERSMKKYYLALVKGNITKKQHCKAYLWKDAKTNQVRILQQPKKDAEFIETAYEPLWNGKDCALLKVDLITGKSHQIRAHLASLGYPLAGDPKYGNKSWNKQLQEMTGLKRQFLHAWLVEFPNDSKRLSALADKKLFAPLPSDLESVVVALHGKTVLEKIASSAEK